MRGIRNPLFLWAIGAASLVAGGVGILLAAAILGVPLSLGAVALGYSQAEALQALAYTAILWLPLGFGFGFSALAWFIKGVRAFPPQQPQEAPTAKR